MTMMAATNTHTPMNMHTHKHPHLAHVCSPSHRYTHPHTCIPHGHTTTQGTLIHRHSDAGARCVHTQSHHFSSTTTHTHSVPPLLTHSPTATHTHTQSYRFSHSQSHRISHTLTVPPCLTHSLSHRVLHALTVPSLLTHTHAMRTDSLMHTQTSHSHTYYMPLHTCLTLTTCRHTQTHTYTRTHAHTHSHAWCTHPHRNTQGCTIHTRTYPDVELKTLLGVLLPARAPHVQVGGGGWGMQPGCTWVRSRKAPDTGPQRTGQVRRRQRSLLPHP